MAPFLRSPEVTWRGGGEEVASRRQSSPVRTFLPDLLSLPAARRD
ncbi:hypothetical protein A2U01_0080118 [Trifolium medium]|uniref:Uncharacterized protein n=1 Tax=Trifolium medium TaxID=97028 RepID=A0A392TCI2_9FABA|nr:hypothetical protein [Trifolium medium]